MITYLTFAFKNPFLSFLEPRRRAESIIAIKEPFCVQETSHFSFKHGVFDTWICEFPFRTENYKLSFFYHKSAWAINQWRKCSLYTDIVLFFLFILFENIDKLLSKAWERKIKNVFRHLLKKRGLLSPSPMSMPHHYHLCIFGCLVPRPHYYAQLMRFGSHGPRKFWGLDKLGEVRHFVSLGVEFFGSGQAVNNFSALMKDVQQPWRVGRIKRLTEHFYFIHVFIVERPLAFLFHLSH